MKKIIVSLLVLTSMSAFAKVLKLPAECKFKRSASVQDGTQSLKLILERTIDTKEIKITDEKGKEAIGSVIVDNGKALKLIVAGFMVFDLKGKKLKVSVEDEPRETLYYSCKSI